MLLKVTVSLFSFLWKLIFLFIFKIFHFNFPNYDSLHLVDVFKSWSRLPQRGNSRLLDHRIQQHMCVYCIFRPSSPTGPIIIPKLEHSAALDINNQPEDDPRKFDSTGMFHWCPEQSLSTCLIVSSIPGYCREIFHIWQCHQALWLSHCYLVKFVLYI